MPTIDLHCDLLSYLATDPQRTPHDSLSRCSIEQMQQGGIGLQTMAIYTQTRKGSVDKAQRQLNIFHSLVDHYPFLFFKPSLFPADKILIALAIENASGLCEEDENLDLAFSRLDRFGSPLYISLTWNMENRFGGGNESQAGLKREGELFLEYLQGKNIAIDLSHTSDALAHGILNFIDKKNLALTPIASHSNFREIFNHPRNLPTDVAKEIIRRGGIIGLNLIQPFLGKKLPEDFYHHVQFGQSIGAEKHLCFGADFFYESELEKRFAFDENFCNASCYPRLQADCKGMTSDNFMNFIKRQGICY